MTKPIDVLGLNEAAVILNRSPAWVRRLCQWGQIPAHKVGTSWGIRQTDARAYAASHPKREAGRAHPTPNRAS